MIVFRLAFATWLVGTVLIGASAGATSPRPSAASATAADHVQIAQAKPAQNQASPASPPAPADHAAAAAGPEPIGNVAALTGTVTVIRNKDSQPLKLRDDIFLNDIVQTSAASSLGITFDDGTTFHLSANAKITIDNYVYEDGGKQNSAVFNIGRGTIAFVAAAVAKTGDMKIDTPTATLGIRGTTGVVDVPETISAASGTANNVAIKLYPDADGRVGHIEVNDRNGTRLGALTGAASGFTIRPGSGAAGARFAAVPMVIAAREIQRDQGFVRQVHTTQSIGRQIVTEQRAFRRANPGLAPNRNAPPAPQRPSAAPGQNNNRPGGQPLAPNGRQDQPQQPGARPQQNQLPQPGRSPERRGGRQDNPQGGQHQQPAQPQPPAVPGRQGQVQPQQPNRGTPPAAATLPAPPAQVRPGTVQRPAPRLQRPAPPARQGPQRRRPARDGHQPEPR